MVQFWCICMCRQDYLISWLNMIDHWDHAACCNIENLAQRENSMYQVPNRLFSLFSWFVVTLRLWLTFDTSPTWKYQMCSMRLGVCDLKISNVLNKAGGLWLIGGQGEYLGCYFTRTVLAQTLVVAVESTQWRKSAIQDFLWTPFLCHLSSRWQ